jgi:hypothetical protein
MNNDDFRALLQQGGKTTREIAREAVEREFQKRKRGRNAHDGASSSDDDGGKHKKTTRQKSHRLKETNDPSPETSDAMNVMHTYRDRARERREGIITTLTSAIDDNDNEDHKIMNGASGVETKDTLPIITSSKEVEEYPSSSPLKNSVRTTLLDIPQSAADAKQRLVYWENEDPQGITTPLGRSILKFFSYQVYPTIKPTIKQPTTIFASTEATSVGVILQRTQYKIHPANFRMVWTSPEEHISMASMSSDKTTIIHKGIFSYPDLLQKIVQKMRPSNSIQDNNIQDNSTLGTQRDSNHRDPSYSGSKDSDDEDIFDDVGEYVPDYSSTNNQETNQSTKEDPPSIFANLLPNQENEEEGVDLLKDSNQILHLVRQAVSRRHNSEMPKNSLSSYDGRYGEDEMDVDFDGTLDFDSDHNDDKAKKKKKKIKNTSDSGNLS